MGSRAPESMQTGYLGQERAWPSLRELQACNSRPKRCAQQCRRVWYCRQPQNPPQLQKLTGVSALDFTIGPSAYKQLLPCHPSPPATAVTMAAMSLQATLVCTEASPAIGGQFTALSAEISWKPGDLASRRAHNYYSRVEQTTTPDTLTTPLTHLLVQPCPIHLLGVPPGPGNKQDRGHTGRQSDRQRKKEEEGQLLRWHRTLLCMVKL